MPTEESQREYLLGMSDPETVARIEECILDGILEIDHLSCLEDELIDDYVFGRLSEQEQSQFLHHFLSTPDRRGKLAFSRSIQRFASRETRQTPRTRSLFGIPAKSWGFPVWGCALASVLGAAGWLGIRDVHLNRELFEARLVAHDRDRLEAELVQERNQFSQLSATGSKPPVAQSPPGVSAPNTQVTPALTLEPGLTRGIEQTPILHIRPLENLAWIALKIPNDPGGAFREELLGSDGEWIWSQNFSSKHSLAKHGEITLAIPTSLLQPDDYRIKVEQRSAAGEYEELSTYSFRVVD